MNEYGPVHQKKPYLRSKRILSVVTLFALITLLVDVQLGTLIVVVCGLMWVMLAGIMKRVISRKTTGMGLSCPSAIQMVFCFVMIVPLAIVYAVLDGAKVTALEFGGLIIGTFYLIFPIFFINFMLQDERAGIKQFKYCPRCGSKNLRHDVYGKTTCEKCKLRIKPVFDSGDLLWKEFNL